MSFHFGDPFRGWCFLVDGTWMQRQKWIGWKLEIRILPQRLGLSANMGEFHHLSWGHTWSCSYQPCRAIELRRFDRWVPSWVVPSYFSQRHVTNTRLLKHAPVTWWFKVVSHRMFGFSPSFSVTKPQIGWIFIATPRASRRCTPSYPSCKLV